MYLVGKEGEKIVIDRLRQFRKSNGYKQKEMAMEIGVSFSYYCKVEKGYQNPSYDFLVKLKRRFPEVNIDEMFFW